MKSMEELPLMGPSRKQERGLALPAALLLLLVIATMTAVLSRTATEQLSAAKSQQVSLDMFLVAESALQNQMRQMLIFPEGWKVVATLSTKPSSYTQFQPAVYASQNGIPSCSGDGCLRGYYPVGGGLLKNLGPIEGSGLTVNASNTIMTQFDGESPPEVEDVTVDGTPGWVQVERMDRVVTPVDATGANLSTQGNVLGNNESVRFRLTGYSTKQLKARRGDTVLVAVIEMPAT